MLTYTTNKQTTFSYDFDSSKPSGSYNALYIHKYIPLPLPPKKTPNSSITTYSNKKNINTKIFLIFFLRKKKEMDQKEKRKEEKKKKKRKKRKRNQSLPIETPLFYSFHLSNHFSPSYNRRNPASTNPP